MSRRSTESIGRDILQHLTDDLNSKSSQALFDLWNTDIRDPKTKEIIQPKRIHCKTCKSWDDIKAVVTKMQKDGKSLGEIRKATISHKNVLGEFIIDRKGFNPRNVRDDLHITTERIIREWGNKRRPGYGDLAVKSWKTKIKQNWDKLAPNDKKKFIKLFGVKGDLREIHKGHGFASMIGGLADPSNIAPQLGALNTALKENPRFAKDLMEQWGMGGDGTKAFFNSRLAKIDPTNIPDAVWLHLGETGVVDPEQLEILTAKLGELKQQGVNIEEAAQRIWETGEEVTLDKINKHLPTPDPTSIPTVNEKGLEVVDHIPDQGNLLGNDLDLLNKLGLKDQKFIQTLLSGGAEAMEAWRSLPKPLQRTIIGAPLATVGTVFDALEVGAREADYAEDPSLINNIDRGLAYTSGALGAASGVGFVPAEALQLPVQGVQIVSDELQRDRSQDVEHGMQYEADRRAEIYRKQQADKYYRAGGGNAAMVKHGWSIEQTQLQGRLNLNKQFLSTPERTD